MATGAAHGGTRSDAVRANEALSYRQAIDRQLNRTRRQVKLVELGAGSVLLLAGVLGFLLVASLVDHWVISLGYVGRTVLLATLLVGVAWYAWQKVLPLLVRSINPEYAAHAIEESTPSLKNSLLNFLLLRRSPTGVKEVVMEALEKRAATDIATVPVDAAVDRTKVIRMGYLLVGVMAILGLYKILSPKDPFQTAARVFAPWADIARPSRVQISDVQPGSTEVYIGESVKVSAAVAGASEDDPVSVIYSTADGTVIDQRVTMTAAGGGRFEATLPSGGSAGSVSSTGGLQQNTIYRVEAGDAVTSDHRLTVIAAPRIVVEKVEYAYPAYARKAPQSTERGDLKGLEGTRVMITARANQPIKTAWIEFDPDPSSGPAETLKLNVNGDQATGVLVLQLRPDRRTAWRNAYQLRFINERQQQSQQPVLHGIEVLRDLTPEVEIIAPQSREIEVPENGATTIEVRAVDPDFGLTKVDLMGRARNREVVIRSLLEPADGELPQVSRKFTFRPSEWKWKAGEELTYWAVAEDNRTAVPSVVSVSGVAMPTPDPQPNVARTEQYLIRVVPARAANERGGGANDPNATGNEEQPGEGNEGAGQNDSPMNSGQQGKSNSGENQSASDNGDSQKVENTEQGNKENGSSQKSNQSGEKSQQSSGSDSGDGDSQSQQGGGSSSSGDKGESGSQNSDDASAGGESGGSGKPSDKADNQNGAQSGNPSGSQESGEPSQSGTESGSQAGGSKGGSQQGSRSDGNDPQQDDQSGDSAGQQGSRSGRGGAGSKKPEHDGDVFDKLLEEMQQEEGDAAQQQTGEGGQGQKQPGENNAGQNNSGQTDAAQNNAGENNAGQNAAQGGNQRDPMNGNNSAGNNAGEAGAENQADKGNRQDNQNGQRGGEGNETQGNPAQDNAQPGGSEAGGEKAQGGKEQPGKSGSQGGKAGKSDMNNRPQPDGSQQSPAAGESEKPDSQQGSPQQPKGQDDAQGKGPNDQKAPGEGGRPQGAARTDEGDPKSDKQGTGEPKEAGAGQNGDSGAGKNSKDKTGSGQGQETNRDRQKEMSDSSTAAENGETSAPSNSKRQSDSKGGTSGDRSGGGSKGAGQSGGQEGNDTAGSNSAADEGAGAANETGMGETGSKGGQGEKSEGKTGSAGKEKGDGSSSRPGENGSEKGGSSSGQKGAGQQDQPMNSGDMGPQSGQGDVATDPSQSNQSAAARGQKPAGGTGPVVGGGVDADRPPAGYTSTGEYTQADKANLDFAKKATDLVLSKLKEQEHDPDPELLDRMGMTREQMQEFIRRWDRLKSEADRDPSAARELNDALRSLGLKDPKQRKRSGGNASDDQRGLRDSGNRVPPPSRYRDQFDAFRKGAARAGNR